MEAFEDETGAGDDFEGWNVYDAEDKHKRVFFPHIVVYTPVSTITGRFVGGGRTFQLTSTVELYFTERDGVVVTGVTYQRDNATLIYAERAEAILEGLIFPSTIIEDGVPTTRTMNYVFEAGNSQIYQCSIDYIMDYVVV
jgi:hypothetical protein